MLILMFAEAEELGRQKTLSANREKRKKKMEERASKEAAADKKQPEDSKVPRDASLSLYKLVFYCKIVINQFLSATGTPASTF